MRENHEVTTRQPLLDEHGELREPGWSRHLVQQYDREAIKAPKWRIKEWDYYLILGKNFGAAFTISDLGYIGLQSVSFLKFTKEDENHKGVWQHTQSVIDPFPMGKLKLPSDSSAGDTIYTGKDLELRFTVKEGERHISCHYFAFDGKKQFDAEITLQQPPMENMVIATPWDQKHAFYYNQKINGMRASGSITYDGETFTLDPSRDFGTLDWGRGVWTYDNTWYWGSGNTDIDGHHFGWNIGYGFGNTKAASENVLFYDGKVHKLEDVTFHIPENSYMDPWKFTSSDGRFEMDFVPILDRDANMDFKVIVSDQHQVFGHMSGTAILDDGTPIHIKDVLCFAEKVHNRY